MQFCDLPYQEIVELYKIKCNALIESDQIKLSELRHEYPELFLEKFNQDIKLVLAGFQAIQSNQENHIKLPH